MGQIMWAVKNGSGDFENGCFDERCHRVKEQAENKSGQKWTELCSGLSKFRAVKVLVEPIPDEDIGYWYNNLLAAKNELDSLPTEATPLEKTNVLMKLRETLTDSGQQGKSALVCPAGISRCPYNGLIAIILGFSLILAMVFGITIISK
jgi:hypothetical protein